MPNGYSRALRLWTLPLAAVSAALIAPGAEAADDAVVELRVVHPGGALEPGASYVTNTEKIKTDRRARCFTDGEGGSGDVARLPGPTAMGLLETAGDTNKDVNPLSVTDEFGFGLGLCDVGDVEAEAGASYWALTVNHQTAQLGGDQLRVDDRDEVLWSLTSLAQFPPNPELEVRAAPGTEPGTLNVTVVEWICSTEFPPPDPVCTEAPAEGASVTGGDAPAQTNAAGVATVALATQQRYSLQATATGRVPSNVARVCVSATDGACPEPTDPPSRRIYGRDGADQFAATRGWDIIRARGGDDRINLRGGGSDKVNCGRGKDQVTISADDSDDDIAENCEKVKSTPA